MPRTLVTLSLSGLLLTVWMAPPALAQTKSARGTVSALGGSTLTVKAGDQTLNFSVDAKTVLEAEGAGTASQKAAATGAPGPKLGEFLKIGEAVDVTYRDVGGSLHAERVRKVASAGRGGGSTSGDRSETSDGRVDAVTATSLTISGSAGGGGTFTQTLVIDANTKVVGQGAGTTAAAQGGKMVITDYLKPGDRVSVTFRPMGAALHATEVRVTERAK